MPRQSRMLIDGGSYHITNRGHNRYRLFHDIEDYEAYKDIIREYKEKFYFELFHYCLMPNHMHLLLKIGRGIDMPHLLQCLNQKYARHYKRRYNVIGNIFQGRYKSILVDKNSYLVECGRYIERNPFRAGIVKDPSGYDWSSCRFYTRGAEDDIITASPLYLDFGNSIAERMQKYHEYLLEDRLYEYMVDKAIKLKGVPV